MKNKIKNLIKETLKSVNRISLCKGKVRNQITDIASTNENKIPFIFASPGTPWGYMFQRPQQIALSLSKFKQTVFYSVEGNYRYVPDNGVKGLKKISENLYLHNDFNGGLTFDNLNKAILWRYWATQYNYMQMNKNTRCIEIYDWLDDINVHKYCRHDIECHNHLLNNSDLVIVTSQKLYEEAYRIRKDVILLPNACDYDFFSNPKKIKWPELERLRENSEVIVGYYGAIAEWFDWELIKLCAKVYPNWTFLIVGEIYDNTIKNLDLNRIGNIKIWRRVPYNKLSYLVSKFDIAIIPFKVNDITNCVSPVKLFEYMAGGKPVVATAMYEVSRINDVFIGQNHSEFVLLLKEALRSSKNNNFIKNILATAESNGWDKQAYAVLNELKIRGFTK